MTDSWDKDAARWNGGFLEDEGGMLASCVVPGYAMDEEMASRARNALYAMEVKYRDAMAVLEAAQAWKEAGEALNAYDEAESWTSDGAWETHVAYSKSMDTLHAALGALKESHD